MDFLEKNLAQIEAKTGAFSRQHTVLRLHCRMKDPTHAAPQIAWKNKRIHMLAHTGP